MRFKKTIGDIPTVTIYNFEKIIDDIPIESIYHIEKNGHSVWKLVIRRD